MPLQGDDLSNHRNIIPFLSGETGEIQRVKSKALLSDDILGIGLGRGW